MECMRRGQRVARNDRVCTCCTVGAREDEMHFIQCDAYAGVRARYPDLFEGFSPLPSWGDGDMRSFMNRGHDKGAWNRLADMLIEMEAERKNKLEKCLVILRVSFMNAKSCLAAGIYALCSAYDVTYTHTHTHTTPCPAAHAP